MQGARSERVHWHVERRATQHMPLHALARRASPLAKRSARDFSSSVALLVARHDHNPRPLALYCSGLVNNVG